MWCVYLYAVCICVGVHMFVYVLCVRSVVCVYMHVCGVYVCVCLCGMCMPTRRRVRGSVGRESLECQDIDLENFLKVKESP